MFSNHLIFNHENGSVEGMYIDAGENSPLVIIANGHNGFYSYGMFPYIQGQLYRNGISSFSFNYSHGGIEGDNDVFTRLDLYEKNCMRLEKEDILCVLQDVHVGASEGHSKVFVLAHSLGGVPAVFAAKEATGTVLAPDGIILVSSVSKLDFWPETMISKWKETGTYPILNNRTKQELPQGPEFLSEILAANVEWNMQNAVRNLKLPVCIIHGENDEAVPLSHGESLYEWCKESNPANEFIPVANATHTFNTKHPFSEATPELEAMISAAVKWVKKSI